MKSKLIFLVFFLTLFNCGKKKVDIKTGRIEINEKYIKYKSNNYNTQYIIESENDCEIYDLNRLMEARNKLPYGNYKLVYSSYYSVYNELKFTINSEKTTVNFYPDSLDYSYIKEDKTFLLIDRLKEKETLNLYVNASGCFLNLTSKFEITKEGSEYFIQANYYKNKKRLSQRQLQLLRAFEFETNTLDLSDYGCTSYEKYLFFNSSTNDFISAVNGSCWYYGFDYFRESLEE